MYTSDSSWAVIRSAFSEFLLLPTIIIFLFLGLAYFSYNIDHAKIDWLEPSRHFLQSHVFKNSQATSGLLGAIVSGTISVTSLTTTLLLVIVQQSAGSMTTQVFDQFLRRTTNQFYLGFFVGLSLFSMVTLATVNDPFNPVWGGTLAFSLTTVALYLLVLLMYTTINQMRPTEIINAIYERILYARHRQLKMLTNMCSDAPPAASETGEFRCQKGGFLSYIDAKRLSAFLESKCVGGIIAFRYSISDYIPFDEVIAGLHNIEAGQQEAVFEELKTCIRIRIKRNLDFDTAYGIEQLQTIAWTSVSSAQSNLALGKLCVKNLHDIISYWCQDSEQINYSPETTTIIYTDNVVDKLFQTLEDLAVISSESMQHHIFTGIADLIGDISDRAPKAWKPKLERIVLLMISVMGDHVMTSSMETSMKRLTSRLGEFGMGKAAQSLEAATEKLSASLGVLNSRSTRV